MSAGAGDIPERARHLALRCPVALDTIGLERSLPFADRSVDIVTCSQVLHHFTDAEAILLLRELHRVARRLVVVADLRRSWGAVVGIWASSFALGSASESLRRGLRPEPPAEQQFERRPHRDEPIDDGAPQPSS